MPDEPAPAAQTVIGIMPTIWGHIEKIDELSAPVPSIQVKTFLPSGAVLLVRAEIGPQTSIARGIEQLDVSGLREGEVVEVSYQHGSEGWLDADTIYVRPEQAPVG